MRGPATRSSVLWLPTGIGWRRAWAPAPPLLTDGGFPACVRARAIRRTGQSNPTGQAHSLRTDTERLAIRGVSLCWRA